MAIIRERISSRKTTLGNSSRATLEYVITGETDEGAAITLLAATAPATFQNLLPQDYGVEPIGDPSIDGTWYGTVSYSTNQGSNNPPATGDSYFNFDTSGGTVHVSTSRSTTMAAYDDTLYPNGAPDFSQGINVTRDGGAQGTDIVAGAFNFSETHYFDAADVDAAYKLALADATGKVNDAAFKGFAIGEVLFLGASGNRRGTDATDGWEISFRFSVQRSKSNFKVADNMNKGGDAAPGTGQIDVVGWEYVWVNFVPKADATAKVTRQIPAAAYVEQLYESADFSTLDIGTT